MRLSMMKAAATKIRKVNRAFSRIPMMFKPATAQMMAIMEINVVSGERVKKEVVLATALTAEMQAVRM